MVRMEKAAVILIAGRESIVNLNENDESLYHSTVPPGRDKQSFRSAGVCGQDSFFLLRVAGARREELYYSYGILPYTVYS